MSLGRLVVELSVDGDEFSFNIKKADGELRRFIRGAEEADKVVRKAEAGQRSWGRAFRDTVITLGLIRSAIQTVSDVTIGWQKSIVRVNSDMERSIQLMRNFSSQRDGAAATAEAIQDVQALLNRAASAPFNLNSITNAFVKLRVAGMNPAQNSLNTLLDSVAAFGGTDQNLERAAVALQQMSGKGVVSMEELRQQLGESVPTAINAMADALSTTYSDLVKQISLGRVSAKPAVQAMMEELERSFRGRAAAMMDTWGGAVAQFETGARRIALAIGGLEADGYAEGGYFKTLTHELNEITEILNRPEVLASARDLGLALAELVKVAATGVKWIAENRKEIYEWGKAILYLYGAMKLLSIARGAIGAVSGGLAVMTTALGSAGARSLTMGQGMKALSDSALGLNNPLAVASRSITSTGAAAGVARVSLSGLGAAAGVIAGPIGLAATAAIAGVAAWQSYKESLKEAEKAVLDLNGALTNIDELGVLERAYERAQDDFKKRFDGLFDTSTGFNEAQQSRSEEAKLRAIANIEKIEADLITARENIAKINGERFAQAEILAQEKAFAQISNNYNLNKRRLYEQRDSGEINQEQFNAGLGQIGMVLIEEQIESYEAALEKAELAKARAQRVFDLMGNDANLNLRQEVEKQDRLIAAFTDGLNRARESLDNQKRLTLDDTLVNPGGEGKPSFDPLSKFVDSLNVKVARLRANIDETNPYLAQLFATVENLDTKPANFDALVAQGTQLAAAAYEADQKIKNLKEAANGYKEAIERVGEIETQVGAKLNKVENENPWLNASADAQRYRDELEKLTETLQKHMATALSLGDTELAGKIEQTIKNFADTNARLDELAVSDTSKRLNEQTRQIQDSLKTQSELAKTEYDRQIAWLEEYYAKNEELLAKGGDDYAAYIAYKEALDARYKRQQESGLQEWIRANKDASESYKQLWKSSMDSFVDTLVDGMVTGKLEISDFVAHVLKEILKIQMAKMAAGIAETAIGAFSAGFSGFGGGQQNVSSAAGNAGYSTSGYAGAYGFANGGIMTEWGVAQLKQYANGGIANSPQVAVFGEGSMPEAYVPLPDGRTIPVTLNGQLTGAGGEQKQMAPAVQVNVINQSGQQVDGKQQGEAKFDGKQYIIDVVLSAVSKPGPLREAVRGA